MTLDLAPRIDSSIQRTLAAYNDLAPRPLARRDVFPVGPRRVLETLEAGGEIPLSSDDVVQGRAYLDGTWVGLHHGATSGVCERALLRDMALVRAQKWASRSYRMRNCAAEFSAVCDVEHEHGFYWNVAGGGLGLPALYLRNLFFENLGSQAIQVAQRSREYSGTVDLSADLIPGGPIVLKDSLFADIGMNWGDTNRASFALSFFGREIMSTPTAENPTSHTLRTERCENDLVVRRAVVDISRATEPIGRYGATCRGTLYSGPRRKATVQGFIALCGVTDRPVARFERVDDVVIQDCFFHARGGQAWVELENCGRIRVEGCSGNVLLKVGAEIVGPISRGYLRT